MTIKRMFHCALFTLALATVSLPGQAAMVGTPQMQSGATPAVNGELAAQRDWIVEQLVAGGVAADDAATRVASMTDVQVRKLHQRIEEHPAAGSEGLIILILILVITELMGYTDIVPGWPADTAN